MRGLMRLASADVQLFVREPIATFFTIAFAPLLIVLNGLIFGNKPTPLSAGVGSMDFAMPAYAAMVLCIVGFMSIPVSICGYRESGVLRRFRSTPLRPLTFIAADVVSNLLMAFVGVVVLVAAGWVFYHAAFGGSVIVVGIAIALCALSMFSIGYLIAAVAPTARMANIIGLLILYPMIFLSGTFIPPQVMPESVRQISRFLPLTYAVELLRGLWFGKPWSDFMLATAVLLGVLVVCTALAARFFRWE
jgi:ABC-2 type transport system permease protein